MNRSKIKPLNFSRIKENERVKNKSFEAVKLLL